MKYLDSFEPRKFYHVFNHAVGFENLYKDAENKRYFLKKYIEYITPICHTYAYCLMHNHFHFMVKVRSEEELLNFFAIEKQKEVVPSYHDIVMQEFSNFFNAYAKAFNKQWKRRGALFVDNVRRIELNSPTYQKEVIRYIHFNPIKHGFADRVQDWEFSSFNSLISTKETLLERAEVLNWFGGLDTFKSLHQFNDVDWFDNSPDWEFGRM
jgi:REP element-mobilizing transposase RayT